jgi:periplasmic divalent cation tolerance protein
VNISPVKSYFRWGEEFCKEKEDLLIIKTKKDILIEVIGRVKELHSYEVPEIIALPIIDGYDKYLGWIDESTKR